MAFQRIDANPKDSGRWFLGEPRTAEQELLDARDFVRGVRYSGRKPTYVPIEREGSLLAFNFAAFDMPVVSTLVAETIREMARDSVEFFPVTVGADKTEFFIINVLERVPLDENASRILRWTESDGRPEKVGRYRMVTELRVEAQRAFECHIARVSGWEIALIVSTALRSRLDMIPDVGLAYTDV
jgi:hypothetical protein